MQKKSIFNPVDYAAMCRRIEALHPASERQWGSMTAAQMLAHANIPLETGLGKLQLPAEGNFLTRRLLKWYVLGKTSFKPGLPTSKNFIVADVREFEREKQRLLDNLAEAHRRAHTGPWHPHNLFGSMRPEHWGTLTWVHLDHHLKQFSV